MSTTAPKPGPAQVTELRTLEQDVEAYLDLTERMEQFGGELASVRRRLADRGEGKHVTESGVTVTVSPPNRVFNAEKAWGMLTPEQRALCVSRDNSKIKAQLAPALTEQLMEPGTGAARVVVK